MDTTQNLNLIKLNYPLIELAIVEQKQTLNGLSKTSTPKIPINLYALDCQRNIHRTLNRWSRHCGIEALNIFSQIHQLKNQDSQLQNQPLYETYSLDISGLAKQVIKVLATPKSKIDLGECFKCRHRILGLESQDGKCRNCGQSYNYQAQINRQINQIQNLLLTAKELLAVENRLKTSFPERQKLYLSKLYRWTKEQKITNYASAGQPALYKWGEVNKILTSSRGNLTTRKNENRILISSQEV